MTDDKLSAEVREPMDGCLFTVRVPDAREEFADSRVRPDPKERVLAAMIFKHKGRDHPISIARLCSGTGWTQREIKGIVEQLVVTHRMKIGGRRDRETHGYFMVMDAQDLDTATGPYRQQILAMWRRLRVLLGVHALRELHGQLEIEERKEEAHEQRTRDRD
jgi:hypothetical protein